jgi:hypothetical protein
LRGKTPLDRLAFHQHGERREQQGYLFHPGVLTYSTLPNREPHGSDATMGTGGFSAAADRRGPD